MITFEDFQKVEIRVGEIISAEKIPETDKLLKLMVNFGLKPFSTENGSPLVRPDAGLADHSNTSGLGLKPAPTAAAGAGEAVPVAENDTRQIVSGIALSFPDTSVLVGRKCMFVTNLEPRIIRGFESNGMLFAVSTEDGKFSLLESSGDIPVGTRAK